jgi:hypothetical protein
MNGGDATDSGVAGDHRKICGQADQVLEVYDIRSDVFNFPAKGLGDSCGEKMIPKITPSGIVHDAGHGKPVHDFCEDIAIMGLGVTVPGENSDAMAVPLQNTRQPLGMGFHAAVGSWRIAVADLKNPHGISFGRLPETRGFGEGFFHATGREDSCG